MVLTKSAHALRNPGKRVQTSRKRSSLSSAAKATKALQTAERKRRQMKLDDDVDTFYMYHNMEITRIAKDNGRSEKAVRAMLCNSSQFKATRAPNLRNAIIHDLSMKAKARTWRDVDGPRRPQEELQDAIDEGQIKAIGDTIDDEEKARLINQLQEHRDLSRRGVRATNKAAAVDGKQTAKRVGDVMLDLFERTGIRGLALFSHGNPDDAALPHCVDSDDVLAFFQQVLDISPLDLLRRFEQWSCTQDKASHDRNDINSVRKEIVHLVLDGLRKVTKDKKAGMSYVDYNVDIHELKKVELAGWPADIPMGQPAKFVVETARRICDGLRSGAIKWVMMTKTQHTALVKEHNTLRAVTGHLKKQRAQRSDKGVKRGSKTSSKKTSKKARAVEEEDDDDDDEEEDEEDDDEESPMPSTSRNGALTATSPGASTTLTRVLGEPVPIGPDGLPLCSGFDLNAPPSLDFAEFHDLPEFDFRNIPTLDFSSFEGTFGLNNVFDMFDALSNMFTPLFPPPVSTLASTGPAAAGATNVFDTLPNVFSPLVPPPVSTPASTGPPAAAGAAATGLVVGGATSVFSAATNVDASRTKKGVKKRKSGAVDDSAPAPKKARKVRSDKGVQRGIENECASGDAPAKKARKVRSDKGLRRGSAA
ncbi:hypothetical protein B0H10DRAFT_2229866 [Mycena sp. CBHHK59/15]|nr:hypothetical protein B0H10DRAFT_2229866 [Mycena sp. CBHHK59/15]